MYISAIRTVLLASAALGGASAQAQDACPVQTAELKNIQTKYAAEQQTIKDESDSLAQDSEKAKISGTIDFKFKEQHWALDIPEVTMKDQKLALDIPQVTVKDQRIVWDNPTTVMRRIKTGQYPEFRCSGFSCTVKWSDIFTDVPTIEMRRQEIVLGVPEFRADRVDMFLKVPEFKMRREDWFVKVPEITLRNVQVEAEKLEDRGSDLSEKAKELADRIKTDSAKASSSLYQCYRDDLNEKRMQISSQFDLAINQTNATIDTVRAQGANPEALSTDSGSINLIKQRDDLVAKKNETLAQLDKAIADIDASDKATIQSILT